MGLLTDRYIGLAWEIQTKQNPSQSDGSGKNLNNSKIDSNLLNNLRSFWLSQSFDSLDRLFNNEIPRHEMNFVISHYKYQTLTIVDDKLPIM